LNQNRLQTCFDVFLRELEATALANAIVDYQKNIEKPVGRGPVSQTGGRKGEATATRLFAPSWLTIERATALRSLQFCAGSASWRKRAAKFSGTIADRRISSPESGPGSGFGCTLRDQCP
jgi:hypothetical protein